MTRLMAAVALVLAALALGACAPVAARPSAPAQQPPAAQPEPTPAPEAEESDPMQETTDDALAGTGWALSQIDGAEPAPGGRPATLEFDGAGRLAGSSGCNRFFGGYSLAGATLSVGQMGGTRMACPEPLMAQEATFLAILGAAAEYAVDGDTLTITAADGRALVFTRA